MTDYGFVNLSDNTLNTQYPLGPLPYQIEAWDGDHHNLQDLDAVNSGLGYTGLGAYPVTYLVPEFDPTMQTLSDTYVYVINNDKTITATQNIRNLTSSELQTNLINAKNTKLQAVRNKMDSVINNGAVFKSKTMQIDLASRTTIDGAALLATLFNLQCSANKIDPTGNLRWADPDHDFAWISEDNTSLNMDAPTVVLFGKCVAVYYSKIVSTAREMKNFVLNLDNINEVNNFDENQNWPSPIIG